MNTIDPDKRNAFAPDDEDDEGEEFETMELLERLETLREDMEELGITTLSEVTERIAELHRQLDSN